MICRTWPSCMAGPQRRRLALGQAAAGLVHGHGGHVRPGLHGGDGQLVAEVEVGAVGLVGKAQHPVVVGHLGDGLQVGADAVVGGVVHQHRLGVGVLFDGGLHVLPAHAQGDAQPLVAGGVHIDGHGAAQHHGPHDAAVDVPRGRMIFSPRLATERIMACTAEVVPPTIKKAWAAPKAWAASSSAWRMTETGGRGCPEASWSLL